MNDRVPRFKWQTPPGGWSYTVKATGVTVRPDGNQGRSHSLKGLVTAVVDHMLVNNLEVPDDIFQVVTNDVCNRAGPGFCRGGAVLSGAGDVVAAMTDAVGLKKCAPCSRRQEAMNRAVPFAPSTLVDDRRTRLGL